MDRFIGKRLDGRYEISELIGGGGMAVVYKAYDNIDDRTVAIKILKEEFLANDEFRRRFKNEAKAIAVLSHPNIVKVYDVSFGDVLQYIVMEYINGITLKKYIEQQGIIEWKEAIHFTSQILKALNHAHEKGIIHRDIKPQNIMLLPNGTIKVTDFGIARFSRSEQRTVTNKAIGSVHYISPEQARGDFTDGRSDIYSVGVMLYEMTTGRVPFQAESAVSVAIMQLQNEPENPTSINSLIPRGLEEITLKAMKKDAENRFETAQQMLDDMLCVQQDPYATFNYQFIDVKAGEKNVRKPKERYEEEEPKSNLIPILSGIAIVFVIGLIIAGVFAFNAFNGGAGASFACPDFVGMKYEELLKNEQYKDYNFVQSNESEYNAEYDKGVIYKQSPDAKTQIKKASQITLFVSLGAKEIELSDYSGTLLSLVTEELKDEGLLYEIKKVPSDEYSEGVVISTKQPAGSKVRTGDKITIYVSSGEQVVEREVPDVVGMSSENAQKAIEKKSFKVGSISKDYSDNVPAGYVISQSPDAGEKAAVGDTSVSLVVSKGPKPTAVSTTKAPAEKTVSIGVLMPTANTDATLSVYLDAVEVSNVNLDLSQIGGKSYTVKVSGKGSGHTVKIKIGGMDYQVYSVDFDAGTATLTSSQNVTFVSTEQAE